METVACNPLKFRVKLCIKVYYLQLGVLYDAHKHKHQYNVVLKYFYINMFHNKDQ